MLTRSGFCCRNILLIVNMCGQAEFLIIWGPLEFGITAL